MKRLLLAIVLMLSAHTATAGLSAMNDRCAELADSGAMLTCAVPTGHEPPLLIWIHTNSATDKALREKTNRQVRILLDEYVTAGGREAQVRKTEADGRIYQNGCAKAKGTRYMNCYGWHEVTNGTPKIWESLQPQAKKSFCEKIGVC